MLENHSGYLQCGSELIGSDDYLLSDQRRHHGAEHVCEEYDGP